MKPTGRVLAKEAQRPMHVGRRAAVAVLLGCWALAAGAGVAWAQTAAAPLVTGIQPYQVFSCKGTKASIPFRAESGEIVKAEVILTSGRDKETVARQEWTNVAADPKAPSGPLANPSVVLSLDNVPLGGEYTIRFTRGAATTDIEHILMGEIWVVGGGANAMGAPAKYPPTSGGQVHVFNGAWTKGTAPLFQGPPDMPKDMQLVSPWLRAAIEYADKTGIPVGLVGWARPGMILREALDAENADAERLRRWVAQHAQGATLLGWYQGEGDALDPDGVRNYAANLKKLTASTREIASNPRMLAAIVQLGAAENAAHPDSAILGRIREAQRQYCADDPRAFLVPALPCARRDAVLLSDEGDRYLGLSIAELLIYATKWDKMPQPGPRPASAYLADDSRRRVVVEFDSTPGLLLAPEAAGCFLLTDSKHLGYPFVLGADVAGGVLTLKVEGGRVASMDPPAGGQEVRLKLADSGFIAVSSVKEQGPTGVMLELPQPLADNAKISYCVLDNAKALLRGSDGKYVPAFADFPVGEKEKGLDARLRDAMKKRGTPAPAAKPSPAK